jgi:hypothetical protein
MYLGHLQTVEKRLIIFLSNWLQPLFQFLQVFRLGTWSGKFNTLGIKIGKFKILSFLTEIARFSVSTFRYGFQLVGLGVSQYIPNLIAWKIIC